MEAAEAGLFFAEKSPDAEIFLLGLFCFESSNYARLKSRIAGLFGVDLGSAPRSGSPGANSLSKPTAGSTPAEWAI